MKRLVTVVVVLALVGYAAWPYGQLWVFERTIEARDSKALRDMVVWEEVRDGMRGDARRFLNQTLDQEPEENGGTGDAFARGAVRFLGGLAIEAGVEYYTTTGGFMDLIEELAFRGETVAEGEPRRLRDNLTYAFFTSPTGFKAELRPQALTQDGTPPEPLVLYFEFRNFGWKVTRLGLPLNEVFKD